MRITGGTLKGQLLKGGFASHVRPTTDFVREALMNYLSHRYEIDGADVLDLFSGSGIMALEFLSRGAACVISIDKDTKNIRYQQEIRREKNLSSWQISKGDAFKTLEDKDSAYDIVFADPPFDWEERPALIRRVLQQGWLKPDGYFILEHPSQEDGLYEKPDIENRQYGNCSFAFFRPSSSPITG